MTELLKNEVFGLRCKKCADVIYSHHRHDMRYCKCNTIAIDGGRDYTRILGELTDMESVVINTENNKFYVVKGE